MEVANLEDVLELFAESRSRNMDNSGNAPERVGEITPHEIIHDDDVDLVAILGVRFLQRVSLPRPHNPNEASSIMTNRNTREFPTPERGTPPLRGVPKRAHPRSRTRQ